MKILSVFGTRPEAIKMAPVVSELRRREGVVSWVCVSAQHRELLDDVLKLFSIEPDFDLGIMREGQTPNYVGAQILLGVEEILEEVKPDWLLVQGDTTTAMAAALAAFHQNVSVGHIEAGLRTGHRRHPFPEEINRRIADLVSELLFAPTPRAREQLIREGVPNNKVLVTGNTVIDALLDVAAREHLEPACEIDQLVNRSGKRIIMLTAHRRESFGAPLENIYRAAAQIAGDRDDVHVLYPVHLNPNVSETAHRILGDAPNVSLTQPLDYLSFVRAMKRSHIILTDSGGIQEEAPSLNVPVLVLREFTERPEAVECGAARVVGTEFEQIVAETVRLLDDETHYTAMSQTINPFGDGMASMRILDAVEELNRS